MKIPYDVNLGLKICFTVNGGKKGTAGKKGTFISSTISKQIYSLEVLK